MAMDQPGSWVVCDHVSIHGARPKNGDLVDKATRVIEDHPMPVVKSLISCLAPINRAATSKNFDLRHHIGSIIGTKQQKKARARRRLPVEVVDIWLPTNHE